MAAVPDAAVSFLLSNVAEVLTYRVNLLADSRYVLENLSQELASLRQVMRGLSRYSNTKETVNRFREVVADAEDAVDAYLAYAQLQNSRIWAPEANHHITNITVKFTNLTERIHKLRESITQPYQLLDPVQRTEPTEPEVVEDRVIGFDDAAAHVKDLLTEGPEDLQAVSIVGMTGVGKTTLARKVYNDPLVIQRYMVRVFVHLSKDYDKRKVMLKILASFTRISDEVTKMDETQLEKHLRNQLLGKPYLIVLDDVRETKDWDEFERAFPVNARRCRVLLTSRKVDVAMHSNRNPNSLYKLDFLSFDQCLELLRWRVFRDNHFPEEILEYATKIIEKCDGLPWAIVMIAGTILNNRDSVAWWKKVADSVEDYIARDATQTTEVIKVMYKNLPDHLKSCFLYFGVFHEDEIDVWKLVRLWISEGFIMSEGRVDLEGKAEQYLQELVDRNLVMIGRWRRNGKIKTCSLPKNLLGFCKNKSADENLCQEITNANLSGFLSGSRDLDKYRRLCISSDSIREYLLSGKLKGESVRSLLTFGREKTSAEAELVSSIPMAFKLLRVLEFQSLIFNRFPDDLGNLLLLKYLAISLLSSSSLPSSLSMLLNLQTLIVNTTTSTLDINADIWQMPQFRHLRTNAASTLPTPDTDSQKSTQVLQGKNIRTLCTISPESCKKEVFEQTLNLKKLGICGNLNMLNDPKDGCSFFELLSKLESLENLKLLNDIDYKLQGIPSKNHFPKQLKELTLSNTQLNWKEMSILGALENLEVLKLRDNAFQGNMWQTEKGGFQCLKHLYIGRTDLVIWEAFVDPFPRLESLELNGCDKLQAIPHGFIDVYTLRLMVLRETNHWVAYTARRLQTLMLELAKKRGKKDIFKLSIFPPEHWIFQLI